MRRLLQDFKEKENLQIDSIIEPNIVDNLIYYNEIIILYHKIKGLCKQDILESDRINAILQI